MATLLVLTFIFQIAAQFGVFLYFKANQNYIAKTQCENISRPKMHCNGQCVLAKLLKKTEQEKENKKAFNSRVLDAFVHPETYFEFNNLVVELADSKTTFTPVFFNNPPTSIFHPPPIIA